MAKEQRLGVFLGQKKRYPICSSPLVNVTLELMERSGAFYPQALADPSLMAKLAEASYTIIGFEGIRIPFDLCVEGEAFGCKIKPASVDSPPSILEGAFANPDHCSIPKDIFSRGRFPVVFEAARILKEKYGHHIPIYGGVTGPFTLAGQLCNASKLLRLIIKGPHILKTILDQMTDFCCEYANRLLDAGCEVIIIIDPTASGDLISEKTFRTFLFPIYKKLHQSIKGIVFLHICGNTNPFLSLIAQTGLEGFSFEGPTVEVKKAREFMGKEMLLIGNISTKTLLTGTPDLVKKECRVALQEGIDLLAPSCGIPLKTDLGNLKAMVEAVNEMKGASNSPRD